MNNKNITNKLFRFFDFHRDNRPDAPEEDTHPTVIRYFKLLGRRFWKLISLNIMMLPMILPLLLIVYFYSGSNTTPSQSEMIFPQLYGANLIESSPTSTFLLDVFGTQLNIPVFNNTKTYILMGICALFLLVTYGWQNVGSAYILRSMVRGEPVFLFSDYFYAVKRNLKQGFWLGVMDLLATVLLVLDFLYFSNLPSSFFTDMAYFLILALIVVYFFMRFYLYLMLITFELSFKQLFKNALIFVVLGFKRNIMAVLGIVLLVSFNVLLFALFSMTSLGIAIPLVLLFLYPLAVFNFTTTYAAYPVIDRYMIAPYQGNDAVEEAFVD